MELSKYKKFLKNNDYVHCSVCGNYRNLNSFSHRKSKDHQKNLSSKLRKTAFHLSKKKKVHVVIHDEQWPERDSKRYCHFCGQNYMEHCIDGEFVVEHLGSLYHHANSEHTVSVKAFLKRNFLEEKLEKYCIQQSDLDSFLKKLPEVKAKYLKKMDLLNAVTVNQLKSSEEERKKLVADTLQAQSSFNFQDSSLHNIDSKECALESRIVLNGKKMKGDIKVPPWLEDVADNTAAENQSSMPVIGPTLDTLVKHELKQQKKRFPKNRVGAQFKHIVQGSSKWLPSFQGTWNKGCRKHSQNQFKRRNQK